MEQYNNIQQAYKKLPGEERKPVSFTTPIQAVYDGKTGASLEAILAQFNSIYVQYQGTQRDTRLIIPKEMRRAGLTITYMDMESNTITERANSAVQKDNDHWALDVNWSRVDELSLSGDISVSAAGTWIINGKDTGVKALGPKGDTGLTPWLKTIENRLHFSYDNITWEPCSENIAAWFRWSGNKIQISRDNKTWTDLSGKFADNIHIKGYVASTDALPSGAAQGDIYGVGPTYAAEDTAHTNPIYRYYVRNANEWVDNGSFTSIAAGVVQETGDSETEVMSQKAVSEKLSELGSKIGSYFYMQLNYEGVIKGSSVTPSAAYAYSDFIPVNEGDIIKFKSAGGDTAYLCAGYGTNDFSSFLQGSTANKIGYTNSDNENPIFDIEVVVDANTKYIVLGCDSRIITSRTISLEVKQKKNIIERLSELEATIKGIPNDKVSLDYNGVIQNGISVTPSSVYFYSDFIPVSEGDIIKFKSAGGNSAFLCAGYATNDFSSFLQGSTANKMGYSDESGENPIHDIEVVIDARTKYIVIGCDHRVITSKTIVVEGINGGIISRISKLENSINGEKYINSTSLLNAGIIGNDGIVTPSTMYFYSDFIPVNTGDTITFKSAGGEGAYLCSGYSDNNFSSFLLTSTANIKGYSNEDGNPVFEIKFIVDDNTKYIVLGCDSRIITTKNIIVEVLDSNGIISRVSKIEKSASGALVPTSRYSVINTPTTQPRKGFVSWCMDCGANFFYNESKEYDKKLIEAGYNNTTYAVLPADLSTQSKRELVKYFFDLGREMVIHSDARIYDSNSEKEYEELVQTYFKEMNDGGITPSGGWISLGGNTVPYMNMLKKYIGWGQTGPKNYDIINDNEYMLGVNTLNTEPTHFMRLFIEQTPEEVTEEITNKIINRAKEVIDLAANNGSYIIFYTHSYNRPNAVYTLYPEVFDAILEYIKEKHSKGLINIGAVGDMIEYYYSKRYNEYPLN